MYNLTNKGKGSKENKRGRGNGEIPEGRDGKEGGRWDRSYLVGKGLTCLPKP